MGQDRMARVRLRIADCYMRVPDRPRSWLVRATPGVLLTEVMRDGARRDPRYFDTLYSSAEDPYGFDTNEAERTKYLRTLELCGEGPFARGLELGCAIGSFTELLAPRCEELVAVDISEVAVARAAGRLADRPHVLCEVRNLPWDRPAGTFDLVVASDVLLHWVRSDLEEAVRWIDGVLRPGGVLVALHYTPFFGSVLTGSEAHEVLRRTTTLRHDLGQDTELGEGRPYRIDRFRKTGAA